MLPPIRPRPIIPSCISADLLELNSRDAAAALLQRLVVSRRLRAYQSGEAEFLPGNLQLFALVVDHLQAEDGVRTALVQLSCRVQVARAEPVRHDAAGLARARSAARAPVRA